MKQMMVDSYLVEFSYDLMGYEGKGLDRPVQCQVHYNTNNKNWAGFTLAPLYGCCGVVVSSASSNTRLDSAQFHKIKAHIAKWLGYSLMLATVECTNFPEVIGAGKNGWNFVDSFTNKRTNHLLGVMVKHL